MANIDKAALADLQKAMTGKPVIKVNPEFKLCII
jgi:hypothetical protein